MRSNSSSNLTMKAVSSSPPIFSQESHPQPYTTTRNRDTGDSLAKLPPSLLHSLRESFAVLDRANRGSISRDDVATTLNELGLSSNASDLAAYFPAGEPSSLSISTYLQTAGSGVHLLDRPDELLAAFAAFDGDDSGQVDGQELREALLGLAPENGDTKLSEREVDSVLKAFTGRRREGRALGKGEVFRYQEFVRAAGGGDVEGTA
jgi:Ca2+-binding EF-hand superfamily protein